jgi:hypothetical protein
MNDSKKQGEGEDKTPTAGVAASLLSQTRLLKDLEDMLHNRIRQKKREDTQNPEHCRPERLCTEIDTLRWVLSESLSISRRQHARYYY